VTTKRIESEARGEPRWPAVAAILVALTLYALLPSSFLPVLRIAVLVIGLALLVPTIAVNPVRLKHQTPWSRRASVALTALLAIANQVALVQLVFQLLQSGSKEEAPVLLLAAVQVWATNIIVFGLIYWELDRGGPVVRTQAKRADLPEADFRFPQDEDYDTVREVVAGSSKKSDWTANFVDYLYFSLSNAMAFSPPDAVPLTNRAKLLVGFEALGAYVLLVLVIARAVSLLG
jgi:heme/copper-type cytochrome/quinol oxidase subunit 4